MPDALSVRADRTAMLGAVRTLLSGLGLDPDAPGLVETPRRFVDALVEMTTPQPFNATTFVERRALDGGGHDGPPPVMVHGIPFASLCEHHVMPFTGTVSVAYAPGIEVEGGEFVYTVLGLSKLARMASAAAAALTNQERIGDAIVRQVVAAAGALHVAVVVDASHSCMEARGALAHGAMTRTLHTGGLAHALGEAADPGSRVQQARAVLLDRLLATIPSRAR